MGFIFSIVVILFLVNIFSRLNKVEGELKALKGRTLSEVIPAQSEVLASAQPGMPAINQAVTSPNTENPTEMSQLASATGVIGEQPDRHEEPHEQGELLWAKYLARAGVFAIVIGLAFFLKLAIDYGWIGISGRIILGLIVGFGGLALGQVLRAKYKAYSEVLMGGGISVLYVTIFAAHHFYNLISSSVALGFMIGITALCMIMSVIDKAPTIARIGIVGGFLAPLLISTGGMTPTELYTYILILNIGVLAVSVREKWHKLNYVAFVGTFILYNVAASLGSLEQYRMVGLFFLTIYFILFLAVSVMHHVIRKERSGHLDVLFITLNAFWYGVSGYLLLEPIAEGFLGFFLLGVAIVFAGVALVAFAGDKEDRLLNVYLTGLCVAFLTAAIPAQFDGVWITSLFFLEAILLFAIDYSLKGKNLYSLGAVVFIIGMFKFFAYDNVLKVNYEDYVSIMNTRFLMLAFITITAAVLAVISHRAAIELRAENDPEVLKGIHTIDLENLRKISIGFFVVMNLLAVYSITSEINHYYDKQISESRVTYIQTPAESESSYQLNLDQWNKSDTEVRSLENQNNTAVSIAWAIYGAILLALGFSRKSKALRIAGLVLIFMTLAKVFLAFWDVGGIYRVITSIVAGVTALVGSFLYAKYAERIKSTIINP